MFIDGSSDDQIRADIIRNVRALSTEYSRKPFEECLLFLSQASRNGQYLLLYDHVDDPNIDLFPLLPRGTSCTVAITSRNGILGDLYPHAHLQLDVMSADEAVELLHSSNGSTVITGQARKDASAIAQKLGYLPIALQQARDYMQQTKCSATAYLKSLSSNRHRLLGQLSKHQLDMGSISTYATFETSFRGPAAYVRRFLRLVSYFHWMNLPLELVCLAAEHKFSEYELQYVDHDDEFYAAKSILEEIFLRGGKLDIDDLTVQLQRYSLAKVASSANTRQLLLHPLVHEWVRSCIPSKEVLGYQSAAVSLLALGARLDYTEPIQYLAHHVTHMSRLWDGLSINNAAAFGLILQRNGMSQDALRLQERVLKELRGRLDANSVALHDSMERLGITYHKLGRLNDAEVLQKEVLRLRKATIGEQDQSTTQSMLDLASTYVSSGRKNAALQLLITAETIIVETLGVTHLQYLKCQEIKSDAQSLADSPNPEISLQDDVSRGASSLDISTPIVVSKPPSKKPWYKEILFRKHLFKSRKGLKE